MLSFFLFRQQHATKFIVCDFTGVCMLQEANAVQRSNQWSKITCFCFHTVKTVIFAKIFVSWNEIKCSIMPVPESNTKIIFSELDMGLKFLSYVMVPCK